MQSEHTDHQLNAITDLVLRHGGHVTRGSLTNSHLIVAEFPEICFSFMPPQERDEEIRLQWYSHVMKLNPQVFDSVNGSHGRRATLVAKDFATLNERLPLVLDKVSNGSVFVH